MIIVFTGKAGAGKDTAVDRLRYIISTKRFAFADKLKDIAFEIGWNGNKDDKGRRLLQHLGQVGREYDENIWVDYIIKQIKICQPDEVCAITDCRFPNEIKRLREEFEHVVLVRITGRQYDLGENGKDISENSMENYKADYTIVNDGGLYKLDKQLREIVMWELS